MKKFKSVVQEDPMGCGVACVASLLGKSYRETLKLFDSKHASTRGYYLSDLKHALSKKNFYYSSGKVNSKTKKYINKNGSIIFIKRSDKFPSGHYLLKTQKGWMNPWINYPRINPAQGGFNRKLPGEAQWILWVSE